MDPVLLIFLLTYLVIAIGYLPGFRVDRTGGALLGAIAMIVAGGIGFEDAWRAADFGTLALLFGLMIVSGAFYVAGFYHWIAIQVEGLNVSPRGLLAFLIGISGLLSSLLTNDVVVIAMVPLVIEMAFRRGLNPKPFLLGFALAANGGSAGSMIGSPQNMIIAGQMRVTFEQFLRAGVVPSILSLPIIWAALVFIYRGRWIDESKRRAASEDAGTTTINRLELIKAGIVLAAVVVAFLFSHWPYPLVAITAAGALLLNRRAIGVRSSDLLGQVDGNLLLLVFSLFIINAAIAQTSYPSMALHWLADHGLSLSNPHAMLVIMSLLSDLADNSSAVMLLAPYGDRSTPLVTTAALALGAGFSSNIVNFGSLAGIIVVESAARYGVKISFVEFLKAGGIASLSALLVAAAWIAWLQHGGA